MKTTIIPLLFGILSLTSGKHVFVDGEIGFDEANDCLNASIPCLSLNHTLLAANESGDVVFIYPVANGYILDGQLEITTHPVSLINANRDLGLVVLNGTGRHRVLLIDLEDNGVSCIGLC